MITPNLTQLLAQCREAELRRVARAHAHKALPSHGRQELSFQDAITLRFGFPDDAEALARLADLDSAEPLEQPVLLAEVAGGLRAALSLADGRVIADPFHPSAGLVELLLRGARQLEGDDRTRHRGRLLPWRLALRVARTV